MTDRSDFTTRPQRLGVLLKQDLPASIVVFLVALPLCLGIALASGAPLLAGLFSGIVGGLVVGALSGSPLSVSGPAAGLTAIVAAGIAELGAYPAFLTAVVLAGAMQVGFGLLRAGVLARFVPTCVVHGMLAAIGAILILKQIPHALGHDADFEGDESFAHAGGNTFTELVQSLLHPEVGPTVVTVIALAALLAWGRLRGRPIGHWVPAPLVAVLAGTLAHHFALAPAGYGVASADHFVTIPDLGHLQDILFALPFPDFGRLGDPAVWRVAVTIAAVASIESLLSVGASDKLDPLHRLTPTNRELKAQGVGNILAGLLGALPVTAVIVRSSANIGAGAQTRASALIHGAWLLLGVLLLAPVLNTIPLAALAAVLIVMGWKLLAPTAILHQYRRGPDQFIPFAVTLVAILVTDLLVGVLIGIGVGLFFVIRGSSRSSILTTRQGEAMMIRFLKDVSFIHRPALLEAFEQISSGTHVLIDGTRAQHIGPDIIEAIEEFITSAPARGIRVDLRRSPASLNGYFQEDA